MKMFFWSFSKKIEMERKNGVNRLSKAFFAKKLIFSAFFN